MRIVTLPVAASITPASAERKSRSPMMKYSLSEPPASQREVREYVGNPFSFSCLLSLCSCCALSRSALVGGASAR